MKRLFAILLALSITLGLAACGAAPQGSDTTAAGTTSSLADFTTEAADAVTEELPSFKIAFGYAQWESVLGSQYKSAITYLCDAFNSEAVFFDTGMGDEGITNVESLLVSGDIDGIICVSWDTARMAVADKYGVPVIAACQFPSDQEVAGVAAYSTFLGGVVDDEIWAGYNAMKALYDAGVRNVTYSGLTVGYAKGLDDRAAGAKQFLSETPDLNLLTESYSLGTFDADVPTFVASFPEMEGMLFASMLDAVYNAMETEGIADGTVKVAGPDVCSATGDFFERGAQVWTCGGQYASAMIAWAILYNYLIDGTVIITDPSTPLQRKYLEVTSFEDFQNYEKYVNAPEPVYDVAEIKELIHFFNENVTYDDYVKLGEAYSLEDIVARHS